MSKKNGGDDESPRESKNLKSRSKLKKLRTSETNNESGSDGVEALKLGQKRTTGGEDDSATTRKPPAGGGLAAKMLMKKIPKKKDKGGDGFGGGLSKDFESFDILWFDIATKVR